ncbi:hypothetical protein P3X46_022143 [Hevea brasiliensis]|uniref:RING-type E3 ubiquitin transferase n=1 Tax=Hevea brasiliensis TaxID=3981 RepID=A0ABQ9LJP3_HEVBR|nr:RING-H2 finger protein ATL63-like [Hevea brasiliensis]KAJ9167495.1 hypothetical protein P3X46_022143 [Hevea brasiliensis]
MLSTPKHYPLSHFINSISSYDSNIMLAAVISLLVVILFVLLLHIYAKWFLEQARHRRRSSSVSVSHVLRPSRFHHFHAFTLDAFPSSPSTEGLAPSIISSIPLFVYKAEEHEQDLECIICLSLFEENEIGRSLKKCGHDFHVECIDMWLLSHSNCPICRAPAVVGDTACDAKSMESAEAGLNNNNGESRVEIVIDVSNSENENGNENNNVVVNYDTPSSSSSSSLGCSLKRMLSRNRSERKVFQSCNNDSEIIV